MDEMFVPGGIARRLLLRRALGVLVLVGAGARLASARDPVEVIVDNFTFAPTPLMVKAGATVTWVNHDDIPHSIVCPMLKMKSHPMDTDESFAFRFEQAGTYDYICGLHPHMHGQVVVQA